MPTVTMSFSTPDEAEELKLAQNGSAYNRALWDLDQWLRSLLKYTELSESDAAAYQACRDKLHECMQDQEVTLS